MSTQANILDTQQQNSSLVSITDAIPIGIVMIDTDATITMANAEAVRLFGYTADEILGLTIEQLIPDRFHSSHQGLRNSYLIKPERRNMGVGQELYALRKDGSEFPVEIGLNPVSTPTGQSVVATIVDITNRKRLESSFKKIFDAAPCGMLMINKTGEIRLANTQLGRLFGYQADELIEQDMEKLLPHRYRTQHDTLRTQYLNDPTTRSMGPGRDLTGLNKDGTEFPIEIGLSTVETELGTAIIAAIIDISERKKMENNLRQANADLDEFTYVASHDLKSPLRGIINLLDWVTEDLGDDVSPDVANNLGRIQIRTHRMENLIDDLLNYARAGKNSAEFQHINLNELLSNVTEILDIPPQFKITIDNQAEHITSPRAPLETVLRNLISNAIKHHDKEEGNITITVVPDNSWLKFSITDDGPGIPPKAHDRIFKLFQTLDSKTTDRSGIGLAVTKRLIEAHNGTIDVISNDQQRGSTFQFYWPRFARRDLNE